MKISEMELLVRVAQSGSMTLAAQQLQVTPAAVSATVQRIEAIIGVRLFERTTRALHPTEEGRRLLEACSDVVERWQRGVEEARGSRADIEGVVRISAPTDTTYQLLDDVVISVCAEHSHLRVVLDTTDTVKHLHGDAIDLAIRYGPLQDSTLTARKLAQTPGVLVASPDYLAEHGTPRVPDDLRAHRCLTLHLANVQHATWTLHRGDAQVSVTVESPHCSDGYLARKWAVASMGIALKSLLDVIDDLESGRLVRVLPDYTSGPMPVHAVFPSGRFLPARVRALDTAIAERFASLEERCVRWLGPST